MLDNRPAVNVHLDLSFRSAKTCQSRDHYRPCRISVFAAVDAQKLEACR